MTRNMTRSGTCKYSPEFPGFSDELESIELQIDHQSRISIPIQNRFHESDSSQRLLPPRDATPNDSKSSSGCKYFIELNLFSNAMNHYSQKHH